MLTTNDLRQLAAKNITEAELNRQLACFRTGFPYLRIDASAAVGKGIRRFTEADIDRFTARWDRYRTSGNGKIMKFVPASGAASRMFKDLYAYLAAPYDLPTTPFERAFFDAIEQFAFFDALNRCCHNRYGASVRQLMDEGRGKAVVTALLDAEGLNYGALPKGLLLFHADAEHVCTAVEEHLTEGARYAADGNGQVRIHLTVSPEHEPLFRTLIAEKKPTYEQAYGVRYDISFSNQMPETDTVAVGPDNQPFRDADGSLLFRPGGHGALIGNLSRVDADIVFIKNIDNVVPDRRNAETIVYKKALAGLLVELQERVKSYLDRLDRAAATDLDEMMRFLRDELCIEHPAPHTLTDAERIDYIRRKLMRPLRVCGMVRNAGEPGGGPFFAANPDGTVSLQILESSQIDMGNPVYKKLFEQGTHFNPVDMVCAICRPDGSKYDLTAFVDPATGFISTKSKDGRELKALELPGLWNGAMSDWNTVFAEVPASTFNPVKTVNDLLRPEHRPD